MLIVTQADFARAVRLGKFGLRQDSVGRPGLAR